MADKRIDIIIATKNLVAAGFATAAKEARSFNSRIQAATGGSAEATLKLLGGIAKMQIGMNALAAATAAWKGEWEDVDRALTSLPFGIGQIYQLEKQILGTLTGQADKLREIEAFKASIVEHDKESAKQLAAMQSGAKQQEDIFKRLSNSATLRNSANPEATKAYLDFAKQQKEIRESFESFRDPSGNLPEFWKRQRDNLVELAADEYDAVKKKLAETAADAERETQSRLTSLQSELNQKRLRASGKTLDAEIEQIKESYRNRIAAAKTGEERLAIERLRSQDIADARAAATPQMQRVQRRSLAAGPELTNDYRGLTIMTKSQASQMRVEKNTTRMVDLLTQLARSATAASRGIVVGAA